MPQVGFEQMIPVFERTKTFHALEHAAAVTGIKEKLEITDISIIITSSHNK
jgi:hypothetical protein